MNNDPDTNQREAKTISQELYWGLLFAEQDAGGCLIPGRYSRSEKYNHSASSPVATGQDQCGCIHGAAYLAGGWDKAGAWIYELNRVNITTESFDKFAKQEIAQEYCVTVESTLSHFGVSVREDPSDGQ